MEVMVRIYRNTNIRPIKEEDITSLLRYLYSDIPLALEPVGEEEEKAEYLISDYLATFPNRGDAHYEDSEKSRKEILEIVKGEEEDTDN